MKQRPCVLVFAGSDPGGGAGIQADNQAIAALGAHPLTVVTVLTAQDNDRVFAVHPVEAELVREQALPLMAKMEIAAVKIGIVGNRANAEAIAGIIVELRRRQPDLPVVLDPVLASGHGDALAAEEAVQALAPLLALTTVVTPNLPEAVALSHGEPDVERQAGILLQQGCGHVLIKGGHGEGVQVANRWFAAGDGHTWTWPRLPGSFHGSGCTLASALAAQLARGHGMRVALDTAQAYCQRALENAYAIAEGQSIPDRVGTKFKENV
ncbi:MAG: hydroxymethylpyrimidine/phosphomethylpyrimidine kinase [Burkholderiaceae bacterium]|nr:hydroxymethylpyrimidine/phosphomethylpyrimidine kinase [Burkholderiaceae bacterium]